MPQGAVEVEGLREFRSAVKQVGPDLEKNLKRGMKTEVAQPLADEIKAKIPVRSGRWRSVIRGGATAKSSYVQWGRSKVPYAAWMEFGGGIPNKRNRTSAGREEARQRQRAAGESLASLRNVKVRGARISRPFKPGGRWVHPTVENNRETAREAAEKVLEDTMRQARLRLE